MKEAADGVQAGAAEELAATGAPADLRHGSDGRVLERHFQGHGQAVKGFGDEVGALFQFRVAWCIDCATMLVGHAAN